MQLSTKKHLKNKVMTVEKERCPYELYVEQYFGLPNTVNEKHEIKTDFGMLVNLLSCFDQKLKAASSNTGDGLSKDNIVESEEKYLKYNGERYVNESYVIKEFVPAFLRKMLTDGRIKIVEGNKDYFTKILDEPTDIFTDFIPETKEVSNNHLK